MKPWEPERHFLFFYRLQRVLWTSPPFGTAYSFLKNQAGIVRLFWSKESAQRHADLINPHWAFAAAEGMWHYVRKMPLSNEKSHLQYMLCTMRDEKFSNTKANRWLGWIQACVVHAGIATLEDMKKHNREYC